MSGRKVVFIACAGCRGNPTIEGVLLAFVGRKPDKEHKTPDPDEDLHRKHRPCKSNKLTEGLVPKVALFTQQSTLPDL